jgi:hypothetical protein
MQVLAGYYGSARVDEYDPVTGIYYKAIEIERENRGFISKGPSTQVANISIFIPETASHSTLFKDNHKRNITLVLYETGTEENAIKYNMQGHSQVIKNNILKTIRKPKDKLLVSTRTEKHEQTFTELWISDKHGENLKWVTSFPVSHDWHIDVRNSKVRIVSSRNGRFKQKSIEW